MQFLVLLVEYGYEIKVFDIDVICEMVKDGFGFKINYMYLRVCVQFIGFDQVDFEVYVKDVVEKCFLSCIMQGNVEVIYEVIFEG